MTNFNEISSEYESHSLVQKAASEVLFDLLKIQPNDDVLDLGCAFRSIRPPIPLNSATSERSDAKHL